MDRSDCQKALILLDQGWQDGLGEIDFRYVAGHLADCPECASKARSSSRVDSALHELGKALDRATPRSSIAGRVSAALEREGASASAFTGRAEELELARFLERLRRDIALCEQVVQAADRGARLAALGRDQGFKFSEATVYQVLTRYQAANDGGELSDEQLEAVAGGASADFALLQELLGGLPPSSGNTA